MNKFCKDFIEPWYLFTYKRKCGMNYNFYIRDTLIL
jgi:hypothetical protein